MTPWFMLAQAAVPPAATDAVLGGWAQIFTGLDLVTMVGIGILAFIFARSLHMAEEVAVLIPTALGLVYGLLDAWTKAEAGSPTSQVVMLAFKGLIFNGAGATMVGRVIALGVERWWPSAGGTAKAIATEQAVKIVEQQQKAADAVPKPPVV
jgi:hypothetical protein